MAEQSPRPKRVAGAPETPDPLGVPGSGHAFDEELRCSCGTTWFEHQASPRPCRITAQRCRRPEKDPAAGDA